ncbi:cardiolipin synthase ClsB [Roseateles koreensis]|uniref:Cardiolipin synthase B n=1 Tax=Roseateles koreensis TaxID=2987526 RepID=A0ABT5KUQ3_9BURK|nr:cardiolipin synthase ClsB [Roseateles koreensis]MDC8786664.1 cardiolipin synthase ClsB [Roseateles koreensis]
MTADDGVAVHRPGRPTWPTPAAGSFTGGNEVHLLRGGDALFPQQNQAIDQAQREVWLATYIFNDDSAGQNLVASLQGAAARGVKVRVVVDGFGTKACLSWLREALDRPGIALAVFRPIDRWWRWLQPGQLRRLHQKLCVVDGQQAFVGGINVVDDCIDIHKGALDAPRLDFAVALQGPIVGAVSQAARAIWTRAWLGRDIAEELRVLVRSREPFMRLRRITQRLRMSRQPERPATHSVRALPPVCAAFVLRDNLRQRRTIERAYIVAIRGAQQHVDLITPYFYPGQSFRRALRDAARRGVRVRLLLQGQVDYRIAAFAAQALYAELLGHGVQIFEYTPAYLHAKIAVVDAQWATVGSSNIDPLSLLLNLEANVIVRDAKFAASLAAQFDAAVAVSRAVELRQLGGEGLGGVMRRALVAWGAYVYLRVAGATGRY